MSQKSFGIVGGVSSLDWRDWSAWEDAETLPRRDGLALAPSAHIPADRQSDVPTYADLGVHTIINARGAYTVLGGSLMLPEVRAAMDLAAERFVDLEELMEAAGRHIAHALGAPYAIVTNGAAAGLCQTVAAAIAGTDARKMELLPLTESGTPAEVIVQRSHRGEYDHAVRMAGGKWIEVETHEEMEAAITGQTVMLYALGVADHLPQSRVSISEMGVLAEKHGLPLYVDAAAERPDLPNYYLGQGATVVSYSGGKGLRGPQASGILLGSDQRLLWDAFQHGAPHHGLGRPLKLGKEEIMGLVAAVDAWGRRDHAAERTAIDARLAHIRATIEDAAELSPEITCDVVAGMDGAPRAYITHRLRVSWPTALSSHLPTPTGVVQQLLQNDPPIALIEWEGGVDICAHFITMQEAEQIGQALVAALTMSPISRL